MVATYLSTVEGLKSYDNDDSIVKLDDQCCQANRRSMMSASAMHV